MTIVASSPSLHPDRPTRAPEANSAITSCLFIKHFSLVEIRPYVVGVALHFPVDTDLKTRASLVPLEDSSSLRVLKFFV